MYKMRPIDTTMRRLDSLEVIVIKKEKEVVRKLQ